MARCRREHSCSVADKCMISGRVSSDVKLPNLSFICCTHVLYSDHAGFLAVCAGGWPVPHCMRSHGQQAKVSPKERKSRSRDESIGTKTLPMLSVAISYPTIDHTIIILLFWHSQAPSWHFPPPTLSGATNKAGSLGIGRTSAPPPVPRMTRSPGVLRAHRTAVKTRLPTDHRPQNVSRKVHWGTLFQNFRWMALCKHGRASRTLILANHPVHWHKPTHSMDTSPNNNAPRTHVIRLLEVHHTFLLCFTRPDALPHVPRPQLPQRSWTVMLAPSRSSVPRRSLPLAVRSQRSLPVRAIFMTEGSITKVLHCLQVQETNLLGLQRSPPSPS